ncbi:MAG: hypothetical protein ACP5G4_08805, partial [bacterium]
MKTLMILLAITAVTYAGSTSVVINPHSPSYESSRAVNSALYVVSPVQQIDEDTLIFHAYGTDSTLSDTVWVSSKYSRRYWGVKWDEEGNPVDTIRPVEPLFFEDDSQFVFDNVNDSIWS